MEYFKEALKNRSTEELLDRTIYIAPPDSTSFLPQREKFQNSSITNLLHDFLVWIILKLIRFLKLLTDTVELLS